MRTEMTSSYPVSLDKAWDYLRDFNNWPAYYAGMIEIIEPDECRWETPGDIVRLAYRLVGRRIEAEVRLEEMRPAELVRWTASVPGLPDVHQEWRYKEFDDHIELTITMETEEPTSFFGKAIDKTLLPIALERDLKHTMENIKDVLAVAHAA